MPSFNLRIQGLGKYYGNNRVFNDISLSHTNGILGISGSNGSGKSTLMQCLAGIERTSSGQIEWTIGNGPVDFSVLKQHLGYAAPYINLYPELSCAENLHFIMKMRNSTGDAQPIEKALHFAGIYSLQDHLFATLSTGQQQRLRLAAAIVHEPQVLLLDEPGSNLDDEGRKIIESLVAEFKQAEKMAIIASNNPEELALCDRIFSVEDEQFL